MALRRENMKFPKRLKELRESRKMTQQELANVFNISRSAITKYENGERSPDPETLQKFAEFFNVSVDYLLGRTDNIHFPYPDENESSKLGEYIRMSDFAQRLIQLR